MPFSMVSFPDTTMREAYNPSGLGWYPVHPKRDRKIVVDLWALDARFGNLSVQLITNKDTSVSIKYSNWYDIKEVAEQYPDGVWFDTGKVITTTAMVPKLEALEIPICKYLRFDFDNTNSDTVLNFIMHVIGA